MKLIRMAAIAAILAVCAFSQTTISDTLYNQPGDPLECQITISWPTFTTAAGRQVAAGSKVVPVVDGALSVSLWPTEGAAPGAGYTALFVITTGADRGKRWKEFWSVPATPSTVALASVRQWSTLNMIVNTTGVADGYYCLHIVAGVPTLTTVGCPGSGVSGGGSLSWSALTSDQWTALTSSQWSGLGN